MAYPYNVGNNVTITTSGPGDQYYYFYYDLEIQELSSNFITGCTDTSQVVTITQPDSIIISQVVDDVDCNGGSSGSIMVTVQGGTPTYTYLWSNGATTASISSLSAGMYDCTVADVNGCENTLEDIEVLEPASIVASISQTPPGGFVLTVNSPSGGTSPYTYSWREQSSPNTSLGIGLTYSVFSFGTYYLIVTDANGCEQTTNSFTYTPTGFLETNTTLINIQIYPNPFNKETTIDFGRVVKDINLRIFDVLGKLLNEYELKEIDKFIIEREDKVDGVYFVEVEIEGYKTSIVKLIIE
jgi:Ca2+-binding RTX toxin-like protein